MKKIEMWTGICREALLASAGFVLWVYALAGFVLAAVVAAA